MKILNGNRYFDKTDIRRVTQLLLTNLPKRHFIQVQSSSDVVRIENAIKKFSNTLIQSMLYEKAVNIQFIESVYTDLMYPADALLTPATYNQMHYQDITQSDMTKCENWFFNYGLSLIVAEFEKI